MTRRDLDDVFAAIDGALADEEFPDAMRWSPEPATVDAPDPYDGETVWQPPQQYEQAGVDPVTDEPTPYRWGDRSSSTYDAEHDYDPALPIGPRNFPRVSTRRGGIRFPRGRVPDRVILDDPIVEHRPDCSIVHEYLDRPPACQCGALDRAARTTPRQQGRGLPVDHLIVDELYLVDPAHRAEVEEERRRVRDRLVERIGVGLAVPPEQIAVVVPPHLLHSSARCTIEPVYPDLWHLGPAVRAAEDHARAERALRELLADLGAALRPLVEVLTRAAEQTGQAFGEVVESFRQQYLARQPGKLPPPPPALRETDPAAYALQARQSRGTGPDRQLQRQHRPRRHR